MARFYTSPLLFVLFALVLHKGFAQKPWEPTPGDGAAWMERHEAFLENSQTNGEDIRIVFIGSSSIERWAQHGLSIWNAKYGPLGAVNYGIGGDRTEHVIWRIQNGELDGLAPQLMVVYIGSNNVPTSATVEEIQRGVDTVISLTQEKLPETKVLFLTFFPRGDSGDLNATWTKIRNVNDRLVAEYEGNDDVAVLDIFWDLAASWGVIKEELYTSDKLHMNEDGYKQWDISMNDTFYRLLNSQ